MKISVLVVLWIALSGCFIRYANAQEALLSAGGDFTGHGGSVAFSAGQVVYIGHSSGVVQVLEGVQQAYQITDVTAISDIHKIGISCSVYPNPATDILTLKLDDYEESSILFYQLYSITGTLLEKKKIESSQSDIAMKHLVSGVYLLRVLREDQCVRVFKIIKK
ncbi:MAG: T9SS type A sorting domain-containing protein [Prolixibacteraceae bacterium]|nr:T9SS type A sorting domain-containing protein [Prolixibacteraceae bacterium]